MSGVTLNPAVRGRLVTVAQGEVGSPRVSGDGRVVVWNELTGKGLEIRRWQDGRVETLTDNEVPDMMPDVNGDGSVVVWTRETEPNNWDIVQLRDGKESVVSAGPGNELYHAVSADGSTIVFDDDLDGRWSDFRVRQWKDGEVTTVAEGGGAIHEFPVVDGDGGRVAWRRSGEGGSDLWLRDEAGTVKPLLEQKGIEVTPSFSPDGRLLAWSNDSRGDEDVYLWNLQGGNPQVVAGQQGVDEMWPDLSADGRVVAWTESDQRVAEPGMQIVLRDGDQVVPLTADPNGLNAHARLSEDGRVVVWMWQDRENTSDRKIYRFERD